MLKQSRASLGTINSWQVRIVALALLVLLVGGGSQVLVNAMAADVEPAFHQQTINSTQGTSTGVNALRRRACAVSQVHISLHMLVMPDDTDNTFDIQCAVNNK